MAMSTTDETRGIRHAILRALADSAEGLTRSDIALAIQAESDEIRKVNGVISGLMNANPKLAFSIGSTVRLTEAGRKSLGPVAPVAAPLPPAPAPSNAAETQRSDLDEIVDDVVASHREAEKAREALTALRAIEAAVLAHAPGLPADEQARRVIAMITGVGRVAAERDEVRADHARMVDELLAAQSARDEAVADLRASEAAAEAEIASLRAELEAAKAAPPPSDADGHYWTEQGGRHVLSVLRPVDLATVHPMPGSNRFGWELNANEEHGFAATLERARAHAELAAGVRRLGGGE
jgi:hypothetical protein